MMIHFQYLITPVKVCLQNTHGATFVHQDISFDVANIMLQNDSIAIVGLLVTVVIRMHSQ